MPDGFRFGPFELDPLAQRLTREGNLVALTPKAFDLLRLLVEARGQLLHRADLMRQLWPDTIVEEANLTQHIFTLRKTLGALPDGRPYIETVARRGYRFAAQVQGPGGSVVTEAAPVVRRLRWPMIAAASLLTVAVAAAFVWRAAAARAGASSRAVLAVGLIRDMAAPETTAPTAGVLTNMLATSLGRVSDLNVIARSRMLELVPRGADSSQRALADAARRAGATEIVEGELIPAENRSFRLEIRRVDLDRGIVRGGYRVAGTDRIALVDSVTVLIANDFRADAPRGSLAEASTRSPGAYRLYEEGLRAFFQFDAHAANRLFRAAVREDSMFPMANYYAWRAAITVQDTGNERLAERAVELAARASRRDRLLIMTHVGYANHDPRSIAAAETLATSYPNDPEALIRAADAAPDLPRAVRLLNSSIALDSAAGTQPLALCRLCDALYLLTDRYEWADSAVAVERTLQRWRALRPIDPMPWIVLADWLVGVGRRSEADAAQRRYEALGGSHQYRALGGSRGQALIRSLRQDDFDVAEKLCREELVTSDATDFTTYRWYCTILLRIRGRYREAFALIREGRLPRSTMVRRGFPPDPFHQAILAMEMGREPEAADRFRAMADTHSRAEGVRARNSTWMLTLSATAAVAGGDTLRARLLVDSIQAVGQRSAFSRDPRLHHFVRGLLLSRAGRHSEAVPEFQQAMHSPTFGYTRINYELGQSLLALNRPREAIGVVGAALRGGIDGSCTYVTRTEMHELLARLFDASGQRDSAAAHYAVVERAWRASDPSLAPRYEAARQWLDRR